MKRSLVTLATAVLFAWSLTGCIAEDNDNDNDDNDTGDPVAYSILESGQTSGIATERLTVIRDRQAYDQLWEEHITGITSPPDQPEVDFSNEMVVATFLGERSTDRHRMEIIEVRQGEKSFTVEIRVTLPDDDCTVSEGPTQPFRLASISNSDKVVVFTTEPRLGCP